MHGGCRGPSGLAAAASPGACCCGGKLRLWRHRHCTRRLPTRAAGSCRDDAVVALLTPMSPPAAVLLAALLLVRLLAAAHRGLCGLRNHPRNCDTYRARECRSGSAKRARVDDVARAPPSGSPLLAAACWLSTSVRSHAARAVRAAACRCVRGSHAAVAPAPQSVARKRSSVRAARPPASRFQTLHLTRRVNTCQFPGAAAAEQLVSACCPRCLRSSTTRGVASGALQRLACGCFRMPALLWVPIHGRGLSFTPRTRPKAPVACAVSPRRPRC